MDIFIMSLITDMGLKTFGWKLITQTIYVSCVCVRIVMSNTSWRY